jgi:hypothetical protein
LGGGIIGVRFPGVKRHSGATGHCGGTPHSCGSEPAQFNILPDKSGVPAETMRLDFLQHQGAPKQDRPGISDLSPVTRAGNITP